MLCDRRAAVCDMNAPCDVGVFVIWMRYGIWMCYDDMLCDIGAL